jgi:hypothetical protein
MRMSLPSGALLVLLPLGLDYPVASAADASLLQAVRVLENYGLERKRNSPSTWFLTK